MICSNLTTVKRCDALFKGNANAKEAIHLVGELTFNWSALLMSYGWHGLAEIGKRSKPSPVVRRYFFLGVLPVPLCTCGGRGGNCTKSQSGRDMQQNDQQSTAGTAKRILHGNVNRGTRGIITAIKRYYQLTSAFCSLVRGEPLGGPAMIAVAQIKKLMLTQIM